MSGDPDTVNQKSTTNVVLFCCLGTHCRVRESSIPGQVEKLSKSKFVYGERRLMVPIPPMFFKSVWFNLNVDRPFVMNVSVCPSDMKADEQVG